MQVIELGPYVTAEWAREQALWAIKKEKGVMLVARDGFVDEAVKLTLSLKN